MCVAIVVAGGTGERFGSAGGKQLALADGIPVVGHALLALERARSVDSVILVCHPDRVDEFRVAAVDATGVGKVTAVVAGGDTRRMSVACGLDATPASAGIIAVHDGARPLVDPECVDRAVSTLVSRPELAGVVVGHPAFDTVKTVSEDAEVVSTPDRESLWVAQTPQVFRADALRAAHAAADADGFEGTDDASLVERLGGRVAMVEGARWNVKVTVPEDLAVVEALIAERARKGASGD